MCILSMHSVSKTVLICTYHKRNADSPRHYQGEEAERNEARRRHHSLGKVGHWPSRAGLSRSCARRLGRWWDVLIWHELNELNEYSLSKRSHIKAWLGSLVIEFESIQTVTSYLFSSRVLSFDSSPSSFVGKTASWVLQGRGFHTSICTVTAVFVSALGTKFSFENLKQIAILNGHWKISLNLIWATSSVLGWRISRIPVYFC